MDFTLQFMSYFRINCNKEINMYVCKLKMGSVWVDAVRGSYSYCDWYGKSQRIPYRVVKA